MPNKTNLEMQIRILIIKTNKIIKINNTKTKCPLITNFTIIKVIKYKLLIFKVKIK